MMEFKDLNQKMKQRVVARGKGRVDRRMKALERLQQSPGIKRSMVVSQRKQVARRAISGFMYGAFGRDFDDEDPRYGMYYGSYRPTGTEDDPEEELPSQAPTETTVEVDKKQLSTLAETLTQFLNAFSKLTASQVYIGEIKKAISEAQIRQVKESALEKNAPGPLPAPSFGENAAEGGSDQMQKAFGELTDEVEKLTAAVEQNGLSSQGGILPAGGLGKLATGALAGGAAAVGTYAAVQGGAGLLKMATARPEVDLPDNVERPMMTGPQKAQASKYTERLASSLEEGTKRAATVSSAGSALGGGGGYGGADASPVGGDSGAERGSPGTFTAGAGMTGLLDLIASGEGGYNSMNQGGADQGSIRGSTHNASRILGKNLPDMTVGEVKRHQSLPRSHPQRLFAAGRYQIIPSTMRAVTHSAGVRDNQLFDQATQDRLGARLVLNRTPAKNYIEGRSNDADRAVVSLSQEWASLPNLSGRSYYPPYRRTPHTVAQVKGALDAARTNRPVTVTGGTNAGSSSGGGGGGGGTSETPQQAAGGTRPPLASIRSRSGRSVQVAAAYARNFQGFITELENSGYRINELGGYAVRPNVNSPSNLSYHSFGAAIDINPGKNPNIRGAARGPGRNRYTDMPIDVVNRLIRKYGLGWGFNWRSISDAMHFSIAKSEGGSVDINKRGIAPGEISGSRGAATGTGSAPAIASGPSPTSGTSRTSEVMPSQPSAIAQMASEYQIRKAAEAAASEKARANPPIVPGAAPGPSVGQYLSAMKPPKATKPTSRNPVQEYRMYFAA